MPIITGASADALLAQHRILLRLPVTGGSGCGECGGSSALVADSPTVQGIQNNAATTLSTVLMSCA